MLSCIFGSAQNDGIVELWKHTSIKALYKQKGSRTQPENWRGISVGSTFLKLCISVILERISPWYNATILPGQCGFRKSYGCSSAIFNLQSLHHIASRTNSEIHCLFVDLKAAYDWIVRRWLFSSVYNRLGPKHEYIKKNMQIIEKLYQETLAKMEEGQEYFKTTSGLRQGGSESPMLYNLFADYMMREFEVKVSALGLGMKIEYRMKNEISGRRGVSDDFGRYQGSSNIMWIGYADDLVFDWIDRSWLFKCIKVRLGKEDKNLLECVEILEMFYDGLSINVDGEIFVTLCGVRQGGAESSTLFILMIDWVMRDYEYQFHFVQKQCHIFRI